MPHGTASPEATVSGRLKSKLGVARTAGSSASAVAAKSSAPAVTRAAAQAAEAANIRLLMSILRVLGKR